MSKPASIDLFSYVFEKAQSEPIQKQVAIYRALANLAWSEDIEQRFSKLADDLEPIIEQSNQLRLNLTTNT